MKSKYCQTQQGTRETDAILQVYDEADYLERVALNKLTDALMNKVRGLGRESALEVVGKIAILMARKSSRIENDGGEKCVNSSLL